jgi:hypothetical protein
LASFFICERGLSKAVVAKEEVVGVSATVAVTALTDQTPDTTEQFRKAEVSAAADRLAASEASSSSKSGVVTATSRAAAAVTKARAKASAAGAKDGFEAVISEDFS